MRRLFWKFQRNGGIAPLAGMRALVASGVRVQSTGVQAHWRTAGSSIGDGLPRPESQLHGVAFEADAAVAAFHRQFEPDAQFHHNVGAGPLDFKIDGGHGQDAGKHGIGGATFSWENSVRASSLSASNTGLESPGST